MSMPRPPAVGAGLKSYYNHPIRLAPCLDQSLWAFLLSPNTITARSQERWKGKGKEKEEEEFAVDQSEFFCVACDLS